MKKITVLIFLYLLSISCGVKQTRNYLASGDYDSAIDNAVSGLQNNKSRKGKQDYIYLLEEAFAKAKERDLNKINLLIKDSNPTNLEKVFSTYLMLNDRQEKIKPILPLSLINENRKAYFPFEDYADEIVNSKNALSKYLYTNTKALLATNNKSNFRRAYDDLIYLESISSNFKDVKKLTEEALFKGTDFVNVYSKNETNMAIPGRLENDLLDFSTYGLNDKWTVYHNNRQKGIDYVYGIILSFRQINISPEQINEKEFSVEKQIKIGSKKQLDRRGNVVKDSLGNIIYVDDLKLVRALIKETKQLKTAQVIAKIDYIDFKNNQLLQSFPLSSEFIFQNIFSKFRGDIRAVEIDYQRLFDQQFIPFPNNEQMVSDTGEDLKNKLKQIILNNKINR